jgi:predicted nucleotidyltransferase
MGELTRMRDETRRIEAAKLARAALASLRESNIDAWVIGSLARGEFRQHSDIDVLIDARVAKRTKVFWCFFSKKNCLLRTCLLSQ